MSDQLRPDDKGPRPHEGSAAPLDAHLQAALRHAPDADLRAPQLLRARIVAAALQSTETDRPRPGWRRWWAEVSRTPWRLGGAGTLAAALLAATVLWVGRDELPEAGNRSPPPQQTPAPAAPPLADGVSPSAATRPAPTLSTDKAAAGEPAATATAPTAGAVAEAANKVEQRPAAPADNALLASPAESRVRPASPVAQPQPPQPAQPPPVEAARADRSHRAQGATAPPPAPTVPDPPAVAPAPAAARPAPVSRDEAERPLRQVESSAARDAPAAPRRAAAGEEAAVAAAAPRPIDKTEAQERRREADAMSAAAPTPAMAADQRNSVAGAATSAPSATAPPSPRPAGAPREGSAAQFRSATGSAVGGAAAAPAIVARWLALPDASEWRWRAADGAEAALPPGWLADLAGAAGGRWLASTGRRLDAQVGPGAITLLHRGDVQGRVAWGSDGVTISVCDATNRCETAAIDAPAANALRDRLRR